MTLNDLKAGQMATIEAVDAFAPGVLRLMVLGLVEGAEVMVESSAIGGDPIECRVYGASISVRRQQARAIRVSQRAAGE